MLCCVDKILLLSFWLNGSPDNKAITFSFLGIISFFLKLNKDIEDLKFFFFKY